MLRKLLRKSQIQSINLKKAKKKQLKEKQNRELFIYLGNLSLKRTIKEIVFPFILTLIISYLYFSFNSESVLDRVSKIHSSISTVVSIQIGFIITSLALIASFGERAGDKAFKKIEPNDIYENMKSIIESFVYNVKIYIILLILGFFHQFLFEPIIPIVFNKYEIHQFIKYMFKYIYFGVLIFFILHGFIIFMRNVNLIRLYLLSVLKPKGKQDNPPPN